jgi:OmpA-OmpF porin, OOP family
MLRLSVLAGVLLLPVVAVAQPVPGLYIGGEAGGNFAGSLLSSHETTKVDTDPGPLGLASLGWAFGNGLRVEIEGSYRSNEISGISTRRVNGSLEPLTNVDGNVGTAAVMANVAYDIPFHPFGLPLQPYVGAGLGYGWLNLSNASGNGFGTFRLPDNNTFGPGPNTVAFGSAGAFAYQAMLGMSLPVQGVPGLAFTLEYRFFGMARADIPVTRVTTTGDLVNGVLPSNETRNGFVVTDNAALVGMRYTFGVP